MTFCTPTPVTALEGHTSTAGGLHHELVEVDGRRMQLRVGVETGTDVLFIHGIPGSSHTWDPLLTHLPPGIRPLVPDLLGFGQSDRPADVAELQAARQAQLLHHALDELGVQHPVLVSHDFGGPVALRLVLHEPRRYRGLVLSATNAFGDTPIPFPLSLLKLPRMGGTEGLLARVLFSGPSLRAMCRLGARLGRVNVRAAVGDHTQQAAIRRIFASSLADLPGYYGELGQALSTVRIPTLVVWGGHDPFFPVREGQRLVRAIPNAGWVVWEACGHFLPEETPEVFAALLAQWIGTLPASLVGSPNSSPR